MLHVITGGSGSGKSAYAENWLLEQREKNLYERAAGTFLPEQ